MVAMESPARDHGVMLSKLLKPLSRLLKPVNKPTQTSE